MRRWSDDHINEADNRVFWNNIFAYSGTPSAIGDPIETPYANESHVYPNPFTDKTLLTVGLIEPSDVRIEAFDVSGRLLRVMTSPNVTRLHQVEFDSVDRQGRPLASGVYFLRVRAKEALITQKMVISR